ncbi:MAG TPA: hypothetical protein DD417_03895 [Elusimicrobia bacterium]|nr:hypothetical protein [Elusimicrobiota bacterium]
MGRRRRRGRTQQLRGRTDVPGDPPSRVAPERGKLAADALIELDPLLRQEAVRGEKELPAEGLELEDELRLRAPGLEISPRLLAEQEDEALVAFGGQPEPLVPVRGFEFRRQSAQGPQFGAEQVEGAQGLRLAYP